MDRFSASLITRDSEESGPLPGENWLGASDRTGLRAEKDPVSNDVALTMSANVGLPQQGAGSERLVIRPQKPILIVVSFALGTTTAVTAAACLFTGGQLACLMCLTTGAIGFYAVLGGHLWADSERVGGTGLFEWRDSCRRDELAYVHIGIGAYRRCSFVRKDRRVAFTTPSMVYGIRQLMALARYLGVPLYVGARMMEEQR